MLGPTAFLRGPARREARPLKSTNKDPAALGALPAKCAKLFEEYSVEPHFSASPISYHWPIQYAIYYLDLDRYDRGGG